MKDKMETAVILAAGQGTRMKSKTHKVLHTVCGKALIDYAVELVQGVGVEKPIVVVGHGAEAVKDHLQGRALFAQQDPAKGWGTGAAVRAAAQLLPEQGLAFLLVGDAPLFRAESLAALKQAVLEGAGCAALTAVMDDPFGYGRIVKDDEGFVIDSVEEAEATPEQKAIREVNVSLYCVRLELLRKVLPLLPLHEKKGEYYLTDMLPLLAGMGEKVVAVQCAPEDSFGINDRVQLAQAEKIMRGRILKRHMLSGVTIVDPDSTYIDADVTIGQDSVVYPGCTLQGNTRIGEDCLLLPNCRLKDAALGNGVTVESSTLLSCQVQDGTTVGPNAYLRPGTCVGKGCRVGDFVELKNSNIGDGTKISHLTYVGDSDLGKNINLGCGVVFVNYDGKEKHRCVVEDDAFIGCNVNLVAPVHVGKGAYIAAGSTIVSDVEPLALSIARQRQRDIPGWVLARKDAGKL